MWLDSAGVLAGILVAIVLLLAFTVWPIINTVRLAFLNDYNSLSEVGGATFTVGIKNFQTVIGDTASRRR